MKINNDIAFNFFFWLLYFLYQWLGLASLYMGYDKYFINACMALPFSLLFSILTVHVFFKKFDRPANKAMVWAGLFIASLLLLALRRYVNYEFIYPRYFPMVMGLPYFSFGKILVDLVNLYTITGLYALYYFIRSLARERNRTLELLQQKTIAELDLLKGQVHPHFVFNMLNNIYATALKNSPETAELVAHLAGFLDYNLYESSQDRVSVTTELDHLRHYIELQKSRFGDRLEVSVNAADEFHDFQIAPLLLLPLAENCFKHGDSWVKIDFIKNKDMLTVKMANGKTDERTGKSRGLGLANVKKRLLLLYPGIHELSIIDEPGQYLVTLKLNNLEV